MSTAKALQSSLPILAERLPDYFSRLRIAGFSCCHVNEDWIETQCNEDDVAMHKRYLVEFAREVLATGKLSPDLSASLGWREFMRVRESLAFIDQAKVANQLATFVHRRTDEIRAHREAIASLSDRLHEPFNETSLQAFFAREVVATFGHLGAHALPILRRNQALQHDEQTVAAVFKIESNCSLVLLPSVVSSAATTSSAIEGALGIGFRLMTPTAMLAPKFEFGRDTVLHLQELLPNRFNDYGRFDNVEEFCLNILAWTSALHILLPDVLETLRTASLSNSY